MFYIENGNDTFLLFVFFIKCSFFFFFPLMEISVSVFPFRANFIHIVTSYHHSGNDFCGFEMALSILYVTEHLNANTTINIMYKTFVVKPREKNHSSLMWSLLFFI